MATPYEEQTTDTVGGTANLIVRDDADPASPFAGAIEMEVGSGGKSVHLVFDPKLMADHITNCSAALAASLTPAP